jgi:hypothetical protein
LPAQVSEPVLDAVERFGMQGVEPAGAVGADGGKPAFSQHPQLAGHGGLGESELRSDDVYDVAGAALSGGQQLKYASPDRIAEDVEGLHVKHFIGLNIYTPLMNK